MKFRDDTQSSTTTVRMLNTGNPVLKILSTQINNFEKS